MADDIFALIDTLGIDKPLRLAGHDWGGWIGFLMCMREPEMFDRFLACNIPPPWGDPGPFDLRDNLAQLKKLNYQFPLSTPFVSRWLQAGGGRKKFSAGVVNGTVNKQAWADGALDVFLDQFLEPERSAASEHLYRVFLTRETPKIVRGNYVTGRLTTPTRLLFGQDDVAVSEKTITADHSKFADDLRVELVPNCGHFIVDEQPGLVTARMVDWFEGDSVPSAEAPAVS